MRFSQANGGWLKGRLPLAESPQLLRTFRRYRHQDDEEGPDGRNDKRRSIEMRGDLFTGGTRSR